MREAGSWSPSTTPGRLWIDDRAAVGSPRFRRSHPCCGGSERTPKIVIRGDARSVSERFGGQASQSTNCRLPRRWDDCRARPAQRRREIEIMQFNPRLN